jgi:hypothetical protein
MPFDIDFQKQANYKSHVKKFFLYPPFWGDSNNHVPINLNWKSCEFNELNHSIIPNNKGVYCFVVKPKIPNFFDITYLFYVGKTNRTLNERFGEYISDLKGIGKPRPKIFTMLKTYEGCLHFHYAEINDKVDVDICEEKLLNTFIPPINSQIPIAIIQAELKNIYE